MTDYDNTNRGVLFKSREKRNERSADYSGSLNVDGVEYFLDAWIKKSGKGETFMSLSVKRKDRQENRQQKSQPPRDLDDEIPF